MKGRLGFKRPKAPRPPRLKAGKAFGLKPSKFNWEFPEYCRDWDELSRLCKERDGYRCVLCGSSKNIQAAHIVSKRHGGKDVLSNLRTLCIECHAKEHPHMRHLVKKHRTDVKRAKWLEF